jgi:hypothetical protein
MNAIYKTPLPGFEKGNDQFIVVLPLGAEPLKLDCQRGVPTVWWLVDPQNEETTRKVRFIGTRHVHELLRKEAYIGTIYDGPFVWHLFEVV